MFAARLGLLGALHARARAPARLPVRLERAPPPRPSSWTMRTRSAPRTTRRSSSSTTRSPSPAASISPSGAGTRPPTARTSPARVDPTGRPYPPAHDIQMMVDGEAAAALGRAGARALARGHGPDALPAPDRAPARGRPVARGDVARRARRAASASPARCPRSATRPAVQEVAACALQVDRRGAALHLHREPVPDLGGRSAPRWRAGWPSRTAPRSSSCSRARSTAGWSRARWASCAARLLRHLRASDRHGRLRLLLPDHPRPRRRVHERPRQGDDRRRSVRPRRLREPHQPIDGPRHRMRPGPGRRPGPAARPVDRRRCATGLLAEHLDCDPQAVADALAARGSLIAAVEALRGRARSLAPLPQPAPDERRRRPRPRRPRSRRRTSRFSTASPAIPSSPRPTS